METILIITDFSEAANNAASYSISLAQALGVKQIVLYHSYDPNTMTAKIPISASERIAFLEEREKKLASLRKHIYSMLAEAVAVDIVSDERPLLEGVQALAAKYGKCLLLAGATSKSGLRKFFLGSNTLNLAEHAPIPLLLVPEKMAFRPLEQLLLACNMHLDSDKLPIALLSFLKERLHAQVHVLNVDKPTTADEAPSAALEEQLRVLNPQYHVAQDKDVVRGIVTFVNQNSVDLLISMPQEYGFFEGLFHKSITRQLAEIADLPMLILRKH